MKRGPHPVKLVGGLAIDYFRWSQLTPMVIMWGIVVGGLLLAALINYEEQVWGAAGAIARWISELPVIGPRFTDWVAAQEAQEAAAAAAPAPAHDGGEAFDELMALILKIWAVLSLLFMAVAWLLGQLFGPFEPWPLSRKLRLLGLLCLLFPVGLAIAKFAAPDRVHGDIWLTGFGLAILYFVVSAWCLSISHLLGRLREILIHAEFGRSSSG